MSRLERAIVAIDVVGVGPMLAFAVVWWVVGPLARGSFSRDARRWVK